MFLPDDEKYLLRRFAKNEVVLFLGAGFSANATNHQGKPLPLSRELAEAIWGFLAYADQYDGTSLGDLYEALLRSGKRDPAIASFLESQLLTAQVPTEYDSLVRPFWYRIYTTNVDDLLLKVYRRNADAPRLEIASYPKEELKERDQTLASVQAVFLNGLLPCTPRDVTFSVRQYARRAGTWSPLYQAFVGDYSYLPTVFVGTELNEPLFWQQLEAREGRTQGISELRPKSFLIAPRISPPKRVHLESLNVIPVEATAADFLLWLNEHAAHLPPLDAVLRETMPSVVALFERTGSRPNTNSVLPEFGAAFHLVPTAMPAGGDRSFYLLGATPRWEDIFRDLDAPRELTDRLFADLEAQWEGSPALSVTAILGSAGCGKSTILRRLAVRLSQAGRLVFVTNSEDLPEVSVVISALQQLPQRAALLFDNADIALGQLAELALACRSIPRPPLVVFACRLNDYDRRGAQLQHATDVVEHEVPHLTRAEIVAILQILEVNGLLGPLQGMTQAERIHEFEHRDRAGQQLLIAMREATSGRGFDEIIGEEFSSLPSSDIKLIYLIVALATEAGYRVTPQHIVSSSTLPPAEALAAISRNLRGIVLATGPRLNQLVLRHRIIAAHIVESVAPRTLLANAYKAFVPVLAAEISGHGRRSSALALFRELINHRVIYERFEENLTEARSIYDSVSWTLRHEAHFWLQYGLLELWYGNLELAENYLRQAESLRPNSPYIQTSIGHLYLKQATNADSVTMAYQLRQAGSDILIEQMRADSSPYPYHIYCSQRLAWLRLWNLERDERKRELEHLRAIMRDALSRYPRSRLLQRLREDVESEYLRLALAE